MGNILITSAGKRVSLVRFFKETLQMYYPGASVFTTDMNRSLAPAGFVSDKCFEVPRVTDENYPNLLFDICLENKIRLIIPTIDTELAVLSAYKKKFLDAGIIPVVSDDHFISICRDKRETARYFQDLGIRVPAPINKYNPTFPLFAKPYDGSLSMDTYLISSPDELTSRILNHPKLFFMEYIDKADYQEYTVDMYYGRDHRLKAVVPRERIEIRAGEINKGCTRKNILVSYLSGKMNHLPGAVGCICMQFFLRKKDNDVVGIEMNPRFGGGYPLTHQAKANFIANLIREYLLEEELAYSDDWLDNTLMLRYDDEIIVYEK